MSDDFDKDLMDRSGEKDSPSASSSQKKNKNANEAQIARTTIDERGKFCDGGPDSTIDENQYKDRFSVMPSTKNYTRIEPHASHPANRTQPQNTNNAGSDIPSRRSNASTGSLHMQTKSSKQPQERITSENYTRIYLQKKREREELEHRQKASGGSLPAGTRKHLEQETLQRNNARDLIAQIQWWQSQYGQPDRDDQDVAGMITLLQSQLNAIDPQYWP